MSSLLTDVSELWRIAPVKEQRVIFVYLFKSIKRYRPPWIMQSRGRIVHCMRPGITPGYSCRHVLLQDYLMRIKSRMCTCYRKQTLIGGLPPDVYPLPAVVPANTHTWIIYFASSRIIALTRNLAVPCNSKALERQDRWATGLEGRLRRRFTLGYVEAASMR